MSEAAAPNSAPANTPVGDQAPAGNAPANQAAPSPGSGQPSDLSIDPPAPNPAPENKAAAVVEYEPTGDPGLDLALEFVGQRGFDESHPAMQAAVNGDFSLLEAALAAMGPKAAGYEKHLALAKKSYETTKATAEAKIKADIEAIHKAVGGEENWKAVQKWAGENAEPAERDAVNAALKQGGLVAKVMAQWLAGQYNKAAGTVVNPADATNPGAAGKPDASAPLTAKQFAIESQNLRTKLGYDFEKSGEYKALVARRQAAMRAGR